MKRPILVCCFLALAATTFAPCEATSPDGVVPFETLSHLMIVKVRIDSSKNDYDFVIDTGGVTCIDKNLAEELQLKQKAMMAKANRLELSGFHIDNVFCFTTFDFDHFDALGTPIHGIIGSNLLERYRVTLDFKASTVTLSSDTTGLETPESGFRMPFRNHPINNAPLVSFAIGERRLEGMIDTGQPYPIVFPLEYFDEYRDLHLYDYIKSKGLMEEWPMTTAEHNYLARLRPFDLGNVEIDSAVCLFGELPRVLSMPLIGKDLLSQFKIVIDYPTDEMLLLPYHDIHLEHNRLSIGLNPDLSDSNEVIVKGVWEGSPADIAGIEVGNMILSFGSRKATRANLIDLIEMMEADSTEAIIFEIGDGNTTREMRLKKTLLF
jgi:predicted aspartyl protease